MPQRKVPIRSVLASLLGGLLAVIMVAPGRGTEPPLPGDSDLSFSAPLWPESTYSFVWDMQTMPDGKVLLTRAGATLPVRLNADGTLDSGFPTAGAGSGANGLIPVVSLLPDGKILVGGQFQMWSGDGRYNNLVRLNADGTLDLSFMPVRLGAVRSIVPQPDGKILVGGDSGVVRLNDDGSLDSFQAATFDGNINSLGLLPDGRVVVVGDFHRHAGVAVKGIVRLFSDGSMDPSFKPTAGPEYVRQLALQPDGKILVSGFSGGSPFLRINSDGTNDDSFRPELIATQDADIVIEPDGKVIVGSGGKIARLNADGSLDNSFLVNSEYLPDHVSSMTLAGSDRLLVGGSVAVDSYYSQETVVRFHSGIGPSPQAKMNSELLFGVHNVGTTTSKDFIIESTSRRSLQVSRVALRSQAPGVSHDFQIESQSCLGVMIEASCAVSVSFSPRTSGLQSVSLVIDSNDPAREHLITVSGEGVGASPGNGQIPTPTASPTPPTPVINRLKQTATVRVPKKVKYQGRTVLLPEAVRTNARQVIRSQVTVSPSGRAYSRVKTTPRGRVIILALGKTKLKVMLRLTAPAVGEYGEYSFVKRWRVKK